MVQVHCEATKGCVSELDDGQDCSKKTSTNSTHPHRRTRRACLGCCPWPLITLMFPVSNNPRQRPFREAESRSRLHRSTQN